MKLWSIAAAFLILSLFVYQIHCILTLQQYLEAGLIKRSSISVSSSSESEKAGSDSSWHHPSLSDEITSKSELFSNDRKRKSNGDLSTTNQNAAKRQRQVSSSTNDTQGATSKVERAKRLKAERKRRYVVKNHEKVLAYSRKYYQRRKDDEDVQNRKLEYNRKFYAKYGGRGNYERIRREERRKRVEQMKVSNQIGPTGYQHDDQQQQPDNEVAGNLMSPAAPPTTGKHDEQTQQRPRFIVRFKLPKKNADTSHSSKPFD